MNVKSGDVYLNTLCLAVYAPGKNTRRAIEAVVKMFDNVAKTDKMIVTPSNVLYVKILKDILSGDIDLKNKGELSAVLLKFSDEPAVKNDKTLLPELTRLLMTEETVSPRRIDTLWKNVKNHIVWAKCDSGIRKLMGISLKAATANEVDREIVLQDLIQGLQSTTNEVRDNSDFDDSGEGAPIDSITFNNKESLMLGVKANHKKRNSQLIYFGQQSLNRMFGEDGGVAYGTMMAIAARSHHYKSGRLMDITRWICVYNNPPETYGKTPVVMFFSLENEVHENLIQWFKSAYVNIYQRDPDNLSDEEIVEYCYKEFSKNGFVLHVVRKMGDQFGYHELVEYVDNYEAANNSKVVAVGLDYITLCKRCPEDKNHHDPKQIQLMCERFHNWAGHRDTFFYTGLQLEAEAARVATSGVTNIVKRYGEVHLADCKGAKREFDILWFQEIESNHLGIDYVTTASNKLRYGVVRTEDKYTAHRFSKFGMLDDFGKKDTSVKDIYADTAPDPANMEAATRVVDMF